MSRTNHMSHKPIQKHTQAEHYATKIDGDGHIGTGVDLSPYHLSCLVAVKTNVNNAKNRLDEYYLKSQTDKGAAADWLKFNNIVDIYKELRFEIERKFGGQIVTNAWLKYWDIYSHYGRLQPLYAHTTVD